MIPNMLDNNIIWKATEGKGGGSHNMSAHGGWGITVDGSDETVIAHNLIGYTQDAGIKFRTIEGRIVGSRGGTTRWNKVLDNIFYRCGKAIDFPNRDNTAEGNLYTERLGRGDGRDSGRGARAELAFLAGTALDARPGGMAEVLRLRQEWRLCRHEHRSRSRCAHLDLVVFWKYTAGDNGEAFHTGSAR